VEDVEYVRRDPGQAEASQTDEWCTACDW
jgi:hypothetical protein